MKLEIKKKHNFPPMAWIGESQDGITKLQCGEQVETDQYSFVEGAWSGSFAGKEFLGCEWFCGSGGKILGNGLIYSTPTHVTYGLFISKTEGGGTAFLTPCICC